MRVFGVLMLIIQLLSLIVVWPILLLAGPLLWVLWWIGLMVWVVMILAGGSTPAVIIHQQIAINHDPKNNRPGRREPTF
jgi:hypothetical protein